MKSIETQDDIFSPVDLPCGRTVRNRLVKVAMYEHLAAFFGGPPNSRHFSLYSKWAESDWGMIITGNVQVSNTHLSLGRDIVLPHHISEESLQPFKEWLSSIRGSKGTHGPLAVMQLCHAGRQSTNFIGGRYPFQPPSAPSSIRVKARNSGWLSDVLHTLAFQKPHPMSLVDINDVVDAFVKGAKVALESGFDGVELHAAHGYLLAQFISPKSNTRTDEYSALPNNALRLLHRVVCAIRTVVPKTFILGIKMNAADYVNARITEVVPPETKEGNIILDHFRTIVSWGMVDFIEISGGDYENPDFMETPSRSPRQALFAHFSQTAMIALESLPKKSTPSPLILLTGGLRTPELLITALSSHHTHLLGIGRGSVLSPKLPDLLKKTSIGDSTWSSPFKPEPELGIQAWFRNYLPNIPLVGAGANMAWYVVMIRRLASIPLPMEDKMVLVEPNYGIGGIGAVFWMWVWVDRPYLWILLLAFLVVGIALFGS